MTIVHFYLLHHPEKMARLRSELQETSETATWRELEQLPYLSGCIAEGNRLSFGVAGRTSRIAPHETLQYKQYTIPPGTPISETTLAVHTNESIFPEPWKFKPERWMGKEGTELRKYQMAFNKGSRSCVGMNLAHAEMFLAIAAMARYDMELYETDISDVKFKHEFHVAFPKLDSKGIRAVVEGKVI
jgi:cytochrome P450